VLSHPPWRYRTKPNPNSGDLAVTRALASVLTGTSTAQAPHAMVQVRGSVGMRAAIATFDSCDSSRPSRTRPGATTRTLTLTREIWR